MAQRDQIVGCAKCNSALQHLLMLLHWPTKMCIRPLICLWVSRAHFTVWSLIVQLKLDAGEAKLCFKLSIKNLRGRIRATPRIRNKICAENKVMIFWEKKSLNLNTLREKSHNIQRKTSNFNVEKGLKLQDLRIHNILLQLSPVGPNQKTKYKYRRLLWSNIRVEQYNHTRSDLTGTIGNYTCQSCI